MSPQGSLLTACFNAGWAQAQDLYEAGKIDAFAMMHADQVPEPGWLDILADELERTGADMIGVVAAIKDDRGLTSTAVDDTDDPWLLRRLTMHDVMQMPETFGDAEAGGAILLNTGLWICKLGPWCFDVWFHIHDIIRKEKNRRIARVISEDWDFSRQLRARGCQLLGTRKVKLMHFGETGYPNYAEWGWKEDLQNGPNGVNFKKEPEAGVDELLDAADAAEAPAEELEAVPA
jgi:hypothetical protein